MSNDANEPNKTVKDSGPAPISTTAPGAGEDLLRAGIMQQPDQPGMLGKIGRFDVIKLIGQGGMGQVLLAREPVTNVKVAIKVLKPEFARDAASVHRFLTEARHAYAMGHPNILKVMEVSDSDDRPFYVVPYIEGGSLARRIGPQKPLSTSTTLDVARQIAGALSYAHGRGIIHRDLKPANVLVDGEGRAYLTDFGLLRTVFNDSFVDVQQSALEGTAPYMSPAMVQGKAEDTRCDIYSFGAMLYETLTGQPPYTAPTIEIILKKIAAGPPEPLLKINPKASKPLAAIADWAMARELRDRYATMADVLSDLERVAKGKEPVGPRGVVGLGRPARRNLAIAVAAVGVVALGAFLLSKMTPSSKTSMASDAGQKADLTSGLVAHFPLDGNAKDSSGNGNDGGASGVAWEPDRFNRPASAAVFGGSGTASIILVPPTASLNFRSNLTVSAWIKTTNSSGALAEQHNGGTNGNFVFAILFGRLQFGRSANPQVSLAVNDGQWHHVVGVYDISSKQVRHFVDGTEVGWWFESQELPDKAIPLSIGDENYREWAYAGSIDEVRLYNRTLSPAEIQKLFTAGGSAQNLVVNGSFESPQLTGSHRGLPSGSTLIPGWTVGSTGGVDLVRNYWPPSDGLNSLDLSSLQPGSISQDVLLTEGMGYLLSFEMAYHTLRPQVVSLQVSIGGYSKSFTRDPAAGAPFWRRESFTFIATNTGPATLTFRDTTVRGGDVGAPLDNLSLIAVSPNEVQKLSATASPAVTPAVPAPATPILPVPNRPTRAVRPSAIPGATTPVPIPVAPTSAALPTRRPAESPEARLAKMQAMFKGKVTLRTDGRFEFFYDFSDPAQLDDWISREATAEWAVEDGWLVCKRNASPSGSDTRLHHKALFAGKEHEIVCDAQGVDALAVGLLAKLEDFQEGLGFQVADVHNHPAAVGGRMGYIATTNLGAIDPKHTYQIAAAINGDSFSFVLDGKEILKGKVPPQHALAGQMAFLKLAYRPGRFDNVHIIGALDPAIKAMTYWEHFLKLADAAYDENRFDEAIKLYDTAVAGLEQDQTTDATILKTMKAAALKQRGLASFIPQRDKLPADKQVEALHTKLRELNPNYSGKGQFITRDGRIVEAWLFRSETQTSRR